MPPLLYVVCESVNISLQSKTRFFSTSISLIYLDAPQARPNKKLEMNIGERIAFSEIDKDIHYKRNKRKRLDEELTQLEQQRATMLCKIWDRHPKVFRVCRKRSLGWKDGVFVYECFDAGKRHRCFTQKQMAEQYCDKCNDDPYSDGFPCFVEEVPSHQELDEDNLQELDVVDLENELFPKF
jgi:hypothetical protein